MPGSGRDLRHHPQDREAAHEAHEAHEALSAGGQLPDRTPRSRNYDEVADLVAENVAKTAGKISAKRLLPAARAAGYEGWDRNFPPVLLVVGSAGCCCQAEQIVSSRCR